MRLYSEVQKAIDKDSGSQTAPSAASTAAAAPARCVGADSPRSATEKSCIRSTGGIGTVRGAATATAAAAKRAAAIRWRLARLVDAAAAAPTGNSSQSTLYCITHIVSSRAGAAAATPAIAAAARLTVRIVWCIQQDNAAAAAAAAITSIASGRCNSPTWWNQAVWLCSGRSGTSATSTTGKYDFPYTISSPAASRIDSTIKFSSARAGGDRETITASIQSEILVRSPISQIGNRAYSGAGSDAAAAAAAAGLTVDKPKSDISTISTKTAPAPASAAIGGLYRAPISAKAAAASAALIAIQCVVITSPISAHGRAVADRHIDQGN